MFFNNYHFLNTWPFQPPSSPCHRPMSQNKSNLYKVAGNRRIRLLLVTEKVYFLSYWDLKSLKLRLTSFMKTVTSLVSWASVSSQIVFFLLSKTENMVVNMRTLEPHPELRSNLTSWAWSPAGRQTRCSRNTAPPLHQSQVWPERKTKRNREINQYFLRTSLRWSVV